MENGEMPSCMVNDISSASCSCAQTKVLPQYLWKSTLRTCAPTTPWQDPTRRLDCALFTIPWGNVKPITKAALFSTASRGRRLYAPLTVDAGYSVVGVSEARTASLTRFTRHSLKETNHGRFQRHTSLSCYGRPLATGLSSSMHQREKLRPYYNSR